MKPRWALVCVLVACCGRVGYDAQAPVACTPGPSGAIAEWLADGTNRDSACAALDAVAHAPVGFVPSPHGQAWSFRATNASAQDYLLVPGMDGRTLVTARGVTVDAWVYEASFNAYHGSDRMVFNARGAAGWFGGGEALLYLHENGTHYFLVQAGPGNTHDVDWAVCNFGAANSQLGSWHRLTGTYDGQHVRCYVDGVLAASQALSFISTAPARVSEIGRNYPGDVDAVRVFDRALSEAEIAVPWP